MVALFGVFIASALKREKLSKSEYDLARRYANSTPTHASTQIKGAIFFKYAPKLSITHSHAYESKAVQLAEGVGIAIGSLICACIKMCNKSKKEVIFRR